MNSIVAHINAEIIISEVQRLIHSYIMNQITSESRLNIMIDSLLVLSAESETLNIIIIEVWALLEQEKV